MEAEATPRPRLRILLGLVLLAGLAFLPALDNRFALDDTLARAHNDGVANPPIAAPDGLFDAFRRDYWSGIGARSGLYRPVTIASFALTHALLGPGEAVPDEAAEAFPHHAINLVLNAWAACLVLWLLLEFGLSLGAAVLAATLFAVHGLHSEVVATIVGRSELLVFCFGSAGLLLALKTGRRPRLRLAGAAVSMFLAFAAKESALAFVGLLPCFALARGWRRGESYRQTLGRWGLPILVALVPGMLLYCILRASALDGEPDPVVYAANPLCYAPLGARVATAVSLWGEGLWLCLVPWDLACLYGPASTPIRSTLAPGGWLTAAVFAGWLGWAVVRGRSHPAVFLAAAWFFGFSLITANLLFPIGTLFGERLFFIPSLGVCLLLAAGWERLPPGKGRRVVFATAVAYLLFHLGIDFHRSQLWRDHETLLTAEVANHPDTALIQCTAAKLYHAREFQSPEEQVEYRAKAWACIRRAEAADPGYVEPVYLRALVLGREAQHEAAIAALRRALGMPRLRWSGLEADIRKELGRLLLTAGGDRKAGLTECLRALSLRPDDLDLRVRIFDLGSEVLSPEGVAILLREGLERSPGQPILVAQHAGFLLRHAGEDPDRLRVAEVGFRALFANLPETQRSAPRFLEAGRGWAEALHRLGRQGEARALLEDMLRLPGIPAATAAAIRAQIDR